MQSLNKLSTKKHLRNNLKGEQFHIKAFSRIKTGLADFLHASCKKAVRPIIGACRIAAERVQERPFTFSIAGFFQQFALCARKRRGIGLFQHTAWDFPGGLTEAMTILTFQNYVAIAGNGNNIHPIRVFEHIILRNDSTIGEFKALPAHRQPRSADEIFRFQNSPRTGFFVIPCMIFAHFFIPPIFSVSASSGTALPCSRAETFFMETQGAAVNLTWDRPAFLRIVNAIPLPVFLRNRS